MAVPMLLILFKEARVVARVSSLIFLTQGKHLDLATHLRRKKAVVVQELRAAAPPPPAMPQPSQGQKPVFHGT